MNGPRAARCPRHQGKMPPRRAADLTRSNLPVGGGRSGARRPATPSPPDTVRPPSALTGRRRGTAPRASPGPRTTPALPPASLVPGAAHSPSPTAIMPRRCRGRAGAAGPGSRPQQPPPPPLQNSSPASGGSSPRYTRTHTPRAGPGPAPSRRGLLLRSAPRRRRHVASGPGPSGSAGEARAQPGRP